MTGGARLGSSGYFVQPTVFTDVNTGMSIAREEIFGPVCVIMKFKTEAEVLDLANDTIYGLSASVFTENMARAFRIANALESGEAFVRPSKST